jgi:hypothetical protein
MPPVVDLNTYLPAVAFFLSRTEREWLRSQVSVFVRNPRLHSEPFCTHFRDSLPALFYTQFPFRHPEYTAVVLEMHQRPFTSNEDELLREVRDWSWQVAVI